MNYKTIISSVKIKYMKSINNYNLKSHFNSNLKSHFNSNLKSHFNSNLKGYFEIPLNYKKNILPINYTDKHIHFLKWNFIATVAGSANSALATTRILSSLIPSNSAFIIAYNYIGRDIIGQLGGLLFVSKHANKMDRDGYNYGKNSSKLMQVSTIMEVGGSFLPPSLLLPCFGLANIGKNVAWIGTGSINAKCLMNLSKISQKDGLVNISEMYAKVSVINTMASTIGLSLGIGLSKLDMVFPFSSLIMSPFFSLVSYYSYKKAIKGVLKPEHKIFTDNEKIEKIYDDIC
jgi:hypothetical protein